MNNKYTTDAERLSSNEVLSEQDQQAKVLEARRDFIKKYGALAAITPIALTLTMHSKKALASSCTECGP